MALTLKQTNQLEAILGIADTLESYVASVGGNKGVGMAERVTDSLAAFIESNKFGKVKQ